MAKITKTKDGDLKTRVYLGRDKEGRIVSKVVTAPDKKTLSKRIDQVKAEYNDDTTKDMFKTIAKEYIDVRRSTLSPSTISSYNITLNAIQREASWFMDTKLPDIDKRAMDRLITDFRKGNLANNTIITHITTVSSILKDNGKDVKHIPLTKDDTTVEIPTEKEMATIFEASKGTPLEIPILLAAYGPMRRGEICALEPSDIEGNIIHVTKNMVYDVENKEHIIKAPKTKESIRNIPISKEIVKMIQEQGYVTKMTPYQMTQSWNKFLRDNNLPQYHFHSLRHFAVSYFHAIGVPDAYIQRRGGWKGTSVMNRVYRTTIQEEEQKFNDMITDKMSSLLK